MSHKIMVPSPWPTTIISQERGGGREIQGDGHDRRPDRRGGPRTCGHDGSEMAREAGRALLRRREAASVAHDGDGRSRHRHLQPDWPKAVRAYPRTFGAGKTVPSTPFPSRPTPTSSSWRPAASVPTRWSKSSRFPELVDPHTGRKLMERTIIICNTSNMPVAAREASVYTGMAIGDTTARWDLQGAGDGRLDFALGAGAARDVEPSGGAARSDAFPMDLSAIISTSIRAPVWSN